MFTDRQLAAFKYLISQSRDASVLGKRLVLILLEKSERFTKEVCVTLESGLPEKGGYLGSELDDMMESLCEMSSDAGSTHIDGLLAVLGVDFVFSSHDGVFKMNTEMSAPERRRESTCYTFWLAKKLYSRDAIRVFIDRKEFEWVDLTRPGLYPKLEPHSVAL